MGPFHGGCGTRSGTEQFDPREYTPSVYFPSSISRSNFSGTSIYAEATPEEIRILLEKYTVWYTFGLSVHQNRYPWYTLQGDLSAGREREQKWAEEARMKDDHIFKIEATAAQERDDVQNHIEGFNNREQEQEIYHRLRESDRMRRDT